MPVEYRAVLPFVRPHPDPSTYGINKIKAAAANNGETYTRSVAVQMSDGREEVEQSRGGHTVRNAVLGATGVGAVGAAIAAGLSKTGQKKVAAVEKDAFKKIGNTDNKAMQRISAVYHERGINMKTIEPKDTKIGAMSVPLSVTGASAAATAANMVPEDVRRIAAIEAEATEEIKSIDQKVGDEVKSLCDKEGVRVSSFTSSTRSSSVVSSSRDAVVSSGRDAASSGRDAVTSAGKFGGAKIAGGATALGLAGAAAAAGLSKMGQKQAVAVEKKSVKQIASIDKQATKDIATVYRKHFVKMNPVTPKDTKVGSLTVPVSVIGASAAASSTIMKPDGLAKIEKIEQEAKAQIAVVDKKATSELEAICKKEGISTSTFTSTTTSTTTRQMASTATSATTSSVSKFTKSATTAASSATSSINGAGKAAAVGVGAAAVGAAGLFSLGGKSTKEQSTEIQDRAIEEISTVDNKAMSKVASIYRENGLEMPSMQAKSTKIGMTTTALGVAGAGAMARKTTMGSLDLGRIAKAEQEAIEEMKIIDEKATDEIVAIHEREGQWYARPGASRAATAAATAGLGLKSVKKIASIEDTAASKMTIIDNEAAANVKAADEKHASHMYKCAKKSLTLEFWDGEEEAAATKYAMIEEEAADKIAALDEKAEENIRAVYDEDGQTMLKKASKRDYFTTRGIAGATATAAAIENTVTMAKQRKMNLSNKATRSATSTDGPDDSVLEMAHLALYDFGATVASAGTTLTGADMEGPPEYDARAAWTPEERATRGCCA